MKIPDVIYLQWYDEFGEENEEVTWCQDMINDTDIMYTLRQGVPIAVPTYFPRTEE